MVEMVAEVTVTLVRLAPVHVPPQLEAPTISKVPEIDHCSMTMLLLLQRWVKFCDRLYALKVR